MLKDNLWRCIWLHLHCTICRQRAEREGPFLSLMIILNRRYWWNQCTAPLDHVSWFFLNTSVNLDISAPLPRCVQLLWCLRPPSPISASPAVCCHQSPGNDGMRLLTGRRSDCLPSTRPGVAAGGVPPPRYSGRPSLPPGAVPEQGSPRLRVGGISGGVSWALPPPPAALIGFLQPRLYRVCV